MNKMSLTGSKGHVLRCDWWISIHLKASVFHGSFTRGQKVTFFAIIGRFRSILLFLWVSVFHGPLIVDVQICKLGLTATKDANVGGDLNFRFRMLLKGAIIFAVTVMGHHTYWLRSHLGY